MIIAKVLAAWFVVSCGLNAVVIARQAVTEKQRREAEQAVLAEADKIIADAHRARSLLHHPSREYPDHHG